MMPGVCSANNHSTRKRKLRLVRLEKFVKGELESLAKTAENEVAALLQKLPKIPSAEDFTTLFATLGLDDEKLTHKLNQFRDGEQARFDALPAATLPEQVSSAPSAEVIDELAILSADLEKKAKAFDEDAKQADKTELKKKARELEARKWLNEQKASVQDEIARLKKIGALQTARRLTNTTVLSKKKSELAQALVSDAFIERFNSELKALSAARIQVELVQTRTGQRACVPPDSSEERKASCCGNVRCA